MKPENAIEVQNIEKSFKVYFDKSNSLKDKALFWKRNRYEERKVLKGISFEVKKGEAIGLIGHNGCGKSTTLKLLTKIIYPDSGKIEMRGRVSSLIELGAGFHPDMTGRENIYINASIFGLNKAEIESRMEDIISFSELEEFIDNPVRTYSSGMYMRLAFAVAINVDADILLIDEILAVGDINFQTKCFNKLREIKKNGTTIVIVSHSLQQIEDICEKSYWIEDGKIKASGIPKDVHDLYVGEMEEKRIERERQERKHEEKREDELKAQELGDVETIKELPDFCLEESIRVGDRNVEFTDFRLLDERGESCATFRTGESFVIQMDYKRNDKDLIGGNFGIGIFRFDGVHIYGTNTLLETNSLIQLKEQGTVQVFVKDNCLLPSQYYIDIAVHSEEGVKYDDIRKVCRFDVKMKKRDIGICRLDNEWSVIK